MIKVEKGKFEVKGAMLDLLSDYSFITRKLKDMFPDDAEGTLREAFRIGMLSKEELDEEFISAIASAAASAVSPVPFIVEFPP